MLFSRKIINKQTVTKRFKYNSFRQNLSKKQKVDQILGKCSIPKNGTTEKPLYVLIYEINSNFSCENSPARSAE